MEGEEKGKGESGGEKKDGGEAVLASSIWESAEVVPRCKQPIWQVSPIPPLSNIPH